MSNASPRTLAVSPTGGQSALRGVMRLLLRRSRPIVVVATVVAAVSFAVPMLQAPKYAGVASVMINPRQAAAPNAIAPNASQTSAPDSSLVDSEIEVLGSDELLRRVAVRLELGADPEFNPALDNGFSPRKLLSNLLAEGRGRVQAQSASRDQAIVAALDAAVSVRRRAMSYVVDISALSTDPEKAARIANAVVEEYRAMLRESRASAAQSANQWLDERLEQLRVELQAREAAVQQYRAENGLLSPEGTVSLAEQETRAYQGSVLEAQTRLAERQARYNQVQALARAGGSPDSIADVLNSQVIRDLRQRESELARRQIELERRYGELHPSVVQGRADLEAAQNQITAEISRILGSLRNEVEIARAQLNSLQGSLGAARGELAVNNGAAVRLGQLEREAEAARSAFQQFQTRAHEIAGTEQIATEIREISLARPPSRPSTPDLAVALITAICFGLGAGLLVGLIIEQLDDTFGSAEDLELKLGVPAVASVPELSSKILRLLSPQDRHPAGYLIERPMSAFAEAFRVMQTSAAYATLNAGRRIYAVTSALPNEGKTTTAFCLARSLASSATSTLIIDCDVRRRSLNALLDIEPRVGLVQVLEGKADWRSVVGRDEETSVNVLPVASEGADGRSVFASPRFAELLREASENYDVVVLDCPPVLSVAEARVIASLATLTFLVVRWSKTPVAAVRSAVHQLETTGVSVHGAVLNFVNIRAPGRQSYGDSLYYAQSEGSYYVS